MSVSYLPVTTCSRQVRGMSCSPSSRWDNRDFCNKGKQELMVSNAGWQIELIPSRWAMIKFHFIITTICSIAGNDVCSLTSCAISVTMQCRKVHKFSFLFARCTALKKCLWTCKAKIVPILHFKPDTKLYEELLETV